MIDKHVRSAIAVAVTLIFAPATALAQSTYRWVDNNGRVHYGDKPPPDAAKGAQERRLGGSVVETSGPDFATREAAKNFPVTLYVAPNCEAPCVQARELLTKRGVPFSEVNVIDKRSRGQLKEASGDTQVPVLVVGRDVTKGFETGAFNGALDSAGYPKATAAPPRAARSEAPKREAKQENEEQARPKGRYLP